MHNIIKNLFLFLTIFHIPPVIASKNLTFKSANEMIPLIKVQIGKPSRFMFGAVNFASHESFVIDVECGHKKFECPKYCKNVLFRQLYCHPLCFQMNKAEQSLNCGYSMSNRYFSNSSKTLRKEKEAWNGRFVGTRLMWGEYAKEDFVFLHPVDHDYESKFELKTMRFVRGMSMDVRFMSGGLKLGLGPPPTLQQNNFITHLYKEKQIDKPILSFWNVFSKDTYNNKQLMITLGAVKTQHCQKWIIRKNLSKSGWLIEMDMELGGLVFRRNRIAFFAPNGETVSIPQPHLNLLLQGHKIQKFNESYGRLYYEYYSEKQNLSITFLDKNLKISSQEMAQIGNYKNLQYLSLKMNDLYEYKDQPVWIFGNAFFSNYCVYFDYEKNEIGIGQQILDPT